MTTWTPVNKSTTSWSGVSKSATSWTSTNKSLSSNSFLLTEDGFYLLLEDGSSKLILEQSAPTPIVWTSTNKS